MRDRIIIDRLPELTVFVTFQVRTLHLALMSSHHIPIEMTVVASFAACSLTAVVVLIKRGHFVAMVIASHLVVIVIVPVALPPLIVYHPTVIMIAPVALLAVMATRVVIAVVELIVAASSAVMVFIIARAPTS